MSSRTPVQQARYLAVQSLYAWMITQKPPLEVQTDILALNKGTYKSATISYLAQAIDYITTHYEDLSSLIENNFSDATWMNTSPTVRAVLLLATYEMTCKPNIPHKVSINESVWLAKVFAETGGYKFVNATLDKLARRLAANDI